jgi:hypothetical protein
MQFSKWVEQDLFYNRYNCLDILLEEQVVVHPAAGVHKCESNSTDFDPDEEFWVS